MPGGRGGRKAEVPGMIDTGFAFFDRLYDMLFVLLRWSLAGIIAGIVIADWIM